MCTYIITIVLDSAYHVLVSIHGLYGYTWFIALDSTEHHPKHYQSAVSWLSKYPLSTKWRAFKSVNRLNLKALVLPTSVFSKCCFWLVAWHLYRPRFFVEMVLMNHLSDNMHNISRWNEYGPSRPLSSTSCIILLKAMSSDHYQCYQMIMWVSIENFLCHT